MSYSNDLPDKSFHNQVRAMYGNGKLIRMTRESHPEIMNLYAEQYKKANVVERPIYLMESKKFIAETSIFWGKVLISTACAKMFIPLEICAVFGHEAGHLYKMQPIKSWGSALSIASSPLAFIEVMLRDKPLTVSSLILIGVVAAPAGYLGAKLGFNGIENDSDDAAVNLAGARATIEVLKKIRCLQGSAKVPWLNKAFPIHPTTQKRIARIEHKFADQLYREPNYESWGRE